MSNPTQTLQALAQEGLAAYQRGDMALARANFTKVAESGRADASIWLTLIDIYNPETERDLRRTAIERALKLDPRNPHGLIAKADDFARDGDLRSAAAFYSAVVQVTPPDALPGTAAVAARAKGMVEAYSQQFERHLRDAVSKVVAKPSARFAQSVDLIAGTKRRYMQDPRFYYFPELPQIQFYNRADFPFLDKVEAAFPDIRTELMNVLKEEHAFTPYVTGASKRPITGDMQGMLNNTAWSAFFLWKEGQPVPENAARCPKTMAALADAPLTNIKGRAPGILFSLLKPHTRIPPHNGFINTRLICHLPLVVPPNCGLRVGNDSRAPVEGKPWLFDDTIEHEAWNDSDETRVILLFDIWRPELTEDERKGVSAMFEAIDADSGANRTAWDQ